MFSLFSAAAVAEHNTIFRTAERQEVTIAGGGASNIDTTALAATPLFDVGAAHHGLRTADTSFTSAEDIARVAFVAPSSVKALTGNVSASSRIVRWESREFFKFAVEAQEEVTFSGMTGTSVNDSTYVFDAARTVAAYAGNTASHPNQNMDRARGAIQVAGSNLLTARRGFNDGNSITPTCVLMQFNQGILKQAVRHESITIPSGQASVSLDASQFAMDFDNVQIFWGGFTASGGFQNNLPLLYYDAGVQDLVAERGAANSDTVTIYFALAEFWPKWVKSKGRDVITVATGATNGNAAISPAIDLSKSIVEMCGFNTDTAAANANTSLVTLTPTSGSQFDADRVTSSGSITSKLSFDYTEFM